MNDHQVGNRREGSAGQLPKATLPLYVVKGDSCVLEPCNSTSLSQLHILFGSLWQERESSLEKVWNLCIHWSKVYGRQVGNCRRGSAGPLPQVALSLCMVKGDSCVLLLKKITYAVFQYLVNFCFRHKRSLPG